MTEKRCFRCSECKPLSEFYKHPQMADGHLNKCKDCTKRDMSEHRRHDIDAARARDMERHDRRAFAGNRRLAIERAGHRCERCGSDGRLVVHHKDGSGHNQGKNGTPNNDIDNLEVLCRSCHLKGHFIEVRYAGIHAHGA